MKINSEMEEENDAERVANQARALAGKDTAASASKQLAAAKKKIELLERREQGAQRRARQVEAAATAGGIELPKGQNQERSAARKRAPAAAGPASACAPSGRHPDGGGFTLPR